MNPRSVFAIAAFTFASERGAMGSIGKSNALETIMHSHQITDVERIKTFVRGGNARFTLVSQKTGTRFTYLVRRPDDADVFFVRVLTGSSNEDSYTFLGTIKADGSYAHGFRSPIGSDAPSAKAFRWFFDHVADDDLTNLEFWHEGRCGRCGRTLTVPGSIETGFGPDCAEAMGLAAVVRAPGTAPAVATSAHVRAAMEVECEGDPMDEFDGEIQRREADEERARMDRKFATEWGMS